MGFVASVRHLADTTTPQRNRVVDLARAASISLVVLGHWTLAAVTFRHGHLETGTVLELGTWTHPFTWVFQVMPVFFLVGGYVNSLSWRSAVRRGETYGAWLRSRARRLVLPVLPVLLFWLVAGWVGLRTGMTPHTLDLASGVALMPTWFLAAYVLVTALTPVALSLWERWGWGTVVAAGLMAATVDVLSLAADSLGIGFLNYLLVWGNVHQLGFAWLDGELASVRRRAALATTGLAGAALLVALGPYPLSMVGLGTAEVNNSYPTRVTMLFLGMLQAGVLLLLEPTLQRLMRRPAAWRVTVAVNTRIMTLYLWHVTAMVSVIAVGVVMGGTGLRSEPLSGEWWLSRPLWYTTVAAVTVGLVALLGRFETPAADPRPAPPAWRPVLGVAGVCAGLALVAVFGLVGGSGLHWVLMLLPVVSVYAGGIARRPGRQRRTGAVGGVRRPRR